MSQEIPKSYITCIAIVCLTILAVAVLILKSNHFMLESIIIAVSGLAGYNLKALVDDKTIKELKSTVSALKTDKTTDKPE